MSAPKSRLILGLMTFYNTPTTSGRVTDLDTFNKALDLLESRGYKEIDTARIYGEGTQEGFTGQTSWKKNGFTIATKVQYPRDYGDNTADKVFESVEKSLKELGTDKVDVS
jgi:aflatoxin B1 aldehyde reductase